MRILQVAEASCAGTLRIVEALCEGLTSAGHDVTLAHGRRPETPASLRADGDESFRITALDWNRRTITAQARAFGQLRQLVRTMRPDIIHLHSAFAGLVGGWLGRDQPRVYTPHGWASTHRDWRLQRLLGSGLDRFVSQRCDLVGVVSQSEAGFARRFGAKRLMVIPNGLPELDARRGDASEFGQRPATAPGSMPVVVAGGRLVPSRRPVESARILRSLHDVAATRWIGGGPPGVVDELHALDVEVTGWLSHEEALRHVSAATAYLHWSACDGQSVAVLEAMARDVVVIASDIPPNRELLDAVQLFTSEHEAARMLRRVIESPDLRAELATAQRLRAAAHGADAMVRRWTQVYEQTIAAHASTRMR